MSNLSAGTVSLNLVTNTARFSKGLLGAGGMVDKFGKKSLGVAANVAKIGAAAAAAGIGGLALIAKKYAAAIDESAKFARSNNLTIESLTGLKHAATLYGASQTAVNKGIAQLNTQLGEALTGIGPAAEALKLLGLNAEELARLDSAEALGIVSDAINTVGDEATQARLKTDLLGGGWKRFGALLEAGSEGLKAATKDAKQLGLVLSEADAAQVEAANDAMARSSSVLHSIGQRFTVEIAPFVTTLADMFTDGAKSGDGYKETITKIVDTGIAGAKWLVDKWYLFQQTWHGLNILTAQAQQGVADYAQVGWKGISFLIDLNEKFINTGIAGFKLYGNAVNVLWQGIDIAFSYVVQNAAKGFSNLLHQSSTALRAAGFDDLADDAAAAAASIAASTGGMIADAKNEFKQAKADFKASKDEFVGAFKDIANAKGSTNQTLAKLAMDAADTEATETKKYNEAVAKRLEMAQQFETKINEIKNNREKTEKKIEEAAKQRTINHIKNTEQILAAEEAAAKARKHTMQAISSSLGDLMTITEEFKDKNSAAFHLYKGLAAAQAGVNAWLAYSQVMADPLIQPTWLKQGMANVALTAGLVAVNQIVSGKNPGRAHGGPVPAGGFFEVNERGPEMLSLGGRDFLMMGNQSGRVTSNDKLTATGGGSKSPVIHIHNYSGQNVQTKESDDGARLDVIIGRVDSAIAAGIGNGTNRTSRAIERTYGVGRGRSATK